MRAGERGEAWSADLACSPSLTSQEKGRGRQGFLSWLPCSSQSPLNSGIGTHGIRTRRRVNLVFNPHCPQLQREPWKGPEMQNPEPHPRPTKSEPAFAQDVPRIPVHSSLTSAALEGEF